MKIFFYTFIVLLVTMVVFIVMKSSNFIDSCTEDRRLTTTDELLKKVAGELYIEDQSCCVVTNESIFPNDDLNVFQFFDSNKLYVTMAYERKQPLKYSVGHPYYIKQLVVNQCGYTIESYGMKVSEEVYSSHINAVKKSKRSDIIFQ